MIGIRLGAPRARTTDGDVVARLRDCHARIFSFLAEAAAIAESYATTADPNLRAVSAGDVHRYFTKALPLHEADEDASIAPRLLAAGAPLSMVRARMEEHSAIDELVAELEIDWRAIARDGNASIELEGHCHALASLSERLTTHLAAEEHDIFPRVDALPLTERLQIVAEMRARRAD
jgi:hypothetical protein